MREKGSMVIVPSSAIETMGSAETLATASIAKQQSGRKKINAGNSMMSINRDLTLKANALLS